MNPKEKLKKIITESKLSEEDKKIWEKVIDLTEEEGIKNILEVIEKGDLGIDFLNANLKKKIEAMRTKDISKMDEIIEEEKKQQEEI